MTFGISAHSLSRCRTGVEVYLDQLLRHLPAKEGDRYHVFSNVDPAPWQRPGLVFEASRFPTRSATMKVLWEQFCLPVILRRRGVDVAHSPLFVLPRGSHARWVVTVHDLSFFLFPETCATWRARYHRWMVPFSVRKAARVIAVSESGRRDLVQVLGVPEEKIAVIRHGVDADFFYRRSPGESEALCRRLGVAAPFILYVGTLEPRKNLPRLLRAFRQATEQGGLPHQLVLAGKPGWGAAAVEAEIERLGLGARVLRLGYVPAESLPALYSAAEALVFPSLYEGFGLPPLEAMACETPVLCSDRASLPEVVGNVAWLLDPKDEGQWADALLRLLRSGPAAEEQRREMGAAGRARACRFSWQEAAQRTRAVYDQVAAGGRIA